MFLLFIQISLSSIKYNTESKVFSLDTKTSSYQIFIGPSDYLIHLYYGERISSEVDYLNKYFLKDFDPNPYEYGFNFTTFTLDEILQEYPSYGTGDFRITCLSGYNHRGISSLRLKYKSHNIQNNIPKPTISGLPHSKSENIDLLDIELFDDFFNATVHLYYAVFEEKDVISRWTTIKNESPYTFTLTKAMSACLDFHDMDYDITTLYARAESERNIETTPLKRGKIVIDSFRGASSHQHNPFVLLSSKKADEKNGNVIGMTLVYSGNFAIEAEVDQSEQTRVTIGINPNQFRFLVNSGETFTTPEALIVFSKNGFGELSRKMHHFTIDHIMQSEWKKKQRPVLINSWEAAYFDFDDEKIVKIAEEASKLGIELFVLDDGWFGHRDNDSSSLGDWFVNPNKIKNGMTDLVNKINALNMKFGLWFEPEMISEDSELFKAHPEYAMRIPDREPLLSRRQLVLDFTNKAVIDNIFEQMCSILNSSNIEYIKWDMNRHITDLYAAELPPEQQAEIFHRYILGVYDLLERITTTFPHLLIEGCSGGGGRFDLGMLYYSPQFWASDDTDPIERLKIQFGTSLAYPISAIGAHVSVSPNHQTKRETSIKTRAVVAMSGTFGYELDVTKLNQSDKDEIIQQVKDYHKYYQLINHGDLYRLMSPFESHYCCAWMFVNDDKSKALLNIVKIMIRPNAPEIIIKLDGLDPEKNYEIAELYPERVFKGATLMRAGIAVPKDLGDFKAFQYEINAIQNSE